MCCPDVPYPSASALTWLMDNLVEDGDEVVALRAIEEQVEEVDQDAVREQAYELLSHIAQECDAVHGRKVRVCVRAWTHHVLDLYFVFCVLYFVFCILDTSTDSSLGVLIIIIIIIIKQLMLCLTLGWVARAGIHHCGVRPWPSDDDDPSYGPVVSPRSPGDWVPV